MTEINRCGRPTKHGKPCQTKVYPGIYGLDVCKVHCTDEDRRQSEARKRAFDLGRISGKESARLELDWARREWEQEYERNRPPCKHFRLTYNGKQIVMINGYAYLWAGEGKLSIGDRVLIPAPYWSPRSGPQEATVDDLGSDYQGEFTSISRRAKELQTQ